MAEPKKIIREARDRFAQAVDAEADDRKQREEDIEFEAGDQWPDRLKALRDEEQRPCLTTNFVRKHKNALLNDIRANRPQIKTLPVDDEADPETAEIYNGMLRHIQVVSDADIAYDTAADGQVTAGLGFFRVKTEVVDEELNEQELRLAPIADSFSVYMDPFSVHPAGADAEWCFVTDVVNKTRLQAEHPKADLSNWEGDEDWRFHWYPDDDSVRVAEYYRLVKEKANILLLEDGSEITEDDYWKVWAQNAQRPTVVANRTKTRKRCEWYKLAGDSVLDSTVIPCSYIPVVKVTGEERRYNGKREYRGIVRDARDPQRMYNYWNSANTEMIALAPKQPFTVAWEAVEDHQDDWNEINTSNKPYLPYNHLDSEGNPIPPPSRSPPVAQNTALLQGLMQSAEDLRQVTGQSQSSFGERGDEKSGRAIIARQKEADTNNFHFVDNLSRSIKHAGRIMVEMIPAIYDTKRIVRVLGEDDTPGFAQLDPTLSRPMVEQEDVTGRISRLYNVGVGRYDVRVVVGPSYATKAEEGAQRLSEVVQAAPELLQVVGDLLFKHMDIPGADELSERMKALLPPQVAQIAEARAQGGDDVKRQVAMMQQAMQQQMQPVLEQLQAALEEAGMENDELAARLEEAEKALKDKSAEIRAKVYEADLKYRADTTEAELKHRSEMAEAEAEVAAAFINSQAGNHDGDAGGRRSSASHVEGADTAANSAAAVVSQHAAMMVQELSQTITQQMGEAMSATSSIAEVVRGLQEGYMAIAQQVSALEGRMSATEADRARVLELAGGLLSGSLSEQQVARRLAARH